MRYPMGSPEEGVGCGGADRIAMVSGGGVSVPEMPPAITMPGAGRYYICRSAGSSDLGQELMSNA